MCRLLSILNGHDEPLKKKWISSWINASLKDPLLKVIVPSLDVMNCRHDDGWGVVSASFDVDERLLVDVRHVRTVKPLSLQDENNIDSFVIPQTVPGRNQLIQANVFHSRKASPNTPVTVMQNHPIPIHVLNEQNLLFLSHNGSVDRGIINESLPSSLRLTTERSLKRHSDTEMLSWLIKSWCLEHQDELEHLPWKSFFRYLIDQHEDRGKSFSLMVHLLQLSPATMNFVLVSAMSEDKRSQMSYYQQYHVSHGDMHVFCSSTVFDRFKEMFSIELPDAVVRTQINDGMLLKWRVDRQKVELRSL